MCGKEPAFLVGDGTRKCTTNVAEEFALKKRLRDRAAREFNEWSIAAITGCVNRSRKHALAGSGFPFNEHCRTDRARSIREFERAVHLGVRAHDGSKSARTGGTSTLLPRAMIRPFCGHCCAHRRSLECLTNLVSDEWLRHDICRTGTNPTEDRTNVDVRCGDQQRDPAMARVEALRERLESTVDGVHIRHDDGGFRAPREITGAIRRSRSFNR
jgi:hypothetical protein